MVVVFRMNKSEWWTGYLGGQVASPGEGHHGEAPDGRDGPEGVEHGGLRGARLEVVLKVQRGARLEVVQQLL